MLNVFITVDTEVWPNSPGWPHTPLPADTRCEREVSAYFHGGDKRTGFGLPYQLRIFRQWRLKATYFVDPLFSFALGTESLRDVLQMISSHEQEVGLHLHPEWLTDPRCAGLPVFKGPLLHQYSEDDQAKLIDAGITRLRELGAPVIRCFRAGSWGADCSTLRALSRAGITVDSSLNAVFSASFPDFSERDNLRHPARHEGIWEFPVTNFVDRPPSGRRPLHVCACSLDEFRAVLEQGESAGWSSVVMVLHGFEFVRVDRIASGHLRPQRLLATRFERLCAYLAANTDRFQTCHFSDLDLNAMGEANPARPLSSSRLRTLRRYAEQAVSRIY